MQCSHSYDNCFIQCELYEKCKDTIVICASFNENCIVGCIEESSCDGMIFVGNDSRYAAVYSVAENALIDAEIWAPLNGELLVYAGNVFDDTYNDSSVRYIKYRLLW